MVRPKSAPRRSTIERKKGEGTAVKRKKVKSGTRAVQEIKYLSSTWHPLIPRANFYRLVKEIVAAVCAFGLEFKIQSSALEALQEASEMYLVQLFEDCQLLSFHAKRVTVKKEDMKLVRRLRGHFDVSNH